MRLSLTSEEMSIKEKRTLGVAFYLLLVGFSYFSAMEQLFIYMSQKSLNSLEVFNLIMTLWLFFRTLMMLFVLGSYRNQAETGRGIEDRVVDGQQMHLWDSLLVLLVGISVFSQIYVSERPLMIFVMGYFYITLAMMMIRGLVKLWRS